MERQDLRIFGGKSLDCDKGPFQHDNSGNSHDPQTMEPYIEKEEQTLLRRFSSCSANQCKQSYELYKKDIPKYFLFTILRSWISTNRLVILV